MSLERVHPAAALFPALSHKELTDLADDIEAHGLREPIVRFEGMVLDGRNRLAACALVGVDPRFVEYEGDDPIAYVASVNLRRRHLDESQRAMLGALLAQLPRGSNQHASIEAPSQARAAQLLNVSRSSVQRATKVLKTAPHLADAVTNGNMSVAEAAAIAPMVAQGASAAEAKAAKPKAAAPEAVFVRVRFDAFQALRAAFEALDRRLRSEMPGVLPAVDDDLDELAVAISRCSMSFRRGCDHCGGPMPEGVKGRTCSPACKDAKRAGKLAAPKSAAPAARPEVVAAPGPTAEEREAFEAARWGSKAR